MSHQTGIKANEKLRKFFSQCKDGKTRAFKISIVDEQLILADQKKINKTWDADFDSTMQAFAIKDQPCYILYRLDIKNSSRFTWLLINWIPDTASVRQKMLYASTKATLKQEFGTSDIEDELQATVFEEITLKGYMKHREDMKVPVPLTSKEEEMRELLKYERTGASDIGIGTKQKTLSGVIFPMSEQARNAILEIGKKSLDYIQLRIDILEEKIHLVESCKLNVTELSKKVPNDSARYHLYLFKHSYEGACLESIIFIYSMPGYICSIRERMLYSSCKASLLESIELLGVKVDKKLEIDCGNDLTQEFLMDEVHPKVSSHKPSFEKPKGPPNRGAKRLTKLQK